MKVQVVRGGSLGPGAGQTGKDLLWDAERTPGWELGFHRAGLVLRLE